MRKSKFTEEQMAYALKQAELGLGVEEVCRRMGISSATFYKLLQHIVAKEFRAFAATRVGAGADATVREQPRASLLPVSKQ